MLDIARDIITSPITLGKCLFAELVEIITLATTIDARYIVSRV